MTVACRRQLVLRGLSTPNVSTCNEIHGNHSRRRLALIIGRKIAPGRQRTNPILNFPDYADQGKHGRTRPSVLPFQCGCRDSWNPKQVFSRSNGTQERCDLREQVRTGPSFWTLNQACGPGPSRRRGIKRQEPSVFARRAMPQCPLSLSYQSPCKRL